MCGSANLPPLTPNPISDTHQGNIGYVSDSAPEPYLDEDTGEWYDTESYCELSYTDIKRALFGALADYL